MQPDGRFSTLCVIGERTTLGIGARLLLIVGVSLEMYSITGIRMMRDVLGMNTRPSIFCSSLIEEVREPTHGTVGFPASTARS